MVPDWVNRSPHELAEKITFNILENHAFSICKRLCMLCMKKKQRIRY
jgi:hypothetical protein